MMINKIFSFWFPSFFFYLSVYRIITNKRQTKSKNIQQKLSIYYSTYKNKLSFFFFLSFIFFFVFSHCGTFENDILYLYVSMRFAWLKIKQSILNSFFFVFFFFFFSILFKKKPQHRMYKLYNKHTRTTIK